MRSLTEDTFDAAVDSGKSVVVDFWAPWCGPCKAIAPRFEALEKEFSSKVTFAKVNVDEHPELAQRFQIRGIPAFVGFQKGQVVDGVTGMDPGALQTLVKKLAAG